MARIEEGTRLDNSNKMENNNNQEEVVAKYTI